MLLVNVPGAAAVRHMASRHRGIGRRLPADTARRYGQAAVAAVAKMPVTDPVVTVGIPTTCPPARVAADVRKQVSPLYAADTAMVPVLQRLRPQVAVVSAHYPKYMVRGVE